MDDDFAKFEAAQWASEWDREAFYRALSAGKAYSMLGSDGLRRFIDPFAL